MRKKLNLLNILPYTNSKLLFLINNFRNNTDKWRIFPLNETRFSGDSIKRLVVFIDLADSTKNTMTMDNLEHIRIYYSKFINSVSENVKSYSIKVLKYLRLFIIYFQNNSECKITKTIRYSTYSIKKVSESSSDESSITYSVRKNLPGSNIKNFIESNSKKDPSFHKPNNNNNKRIILVDDERDILFTYESFLKDYDYDIISFTDPSNVLNYIRNLPNFDNLLVILDIRMKGLNGFQLHQQINSIDPTIKILFVTALDISDELLIIVPGLSKEQILKKPVDRNVFTNTVKKLLK